MWIRGWKMAMLLFKPRRDDYDQCVKQLKQAEFLVI